MTGSAEAGSLCLERNVPNTFFVVLGLRTNKATSEQYKSALTGPTYLTCRLTCIPRRIHDYCASKASYSANQNPKLRHKPYTTGKVEKKGHSVVRLGKPSAAYIHIHTYILGLGFCSVFSLYFIPRKPPREIRSSYYLIHFSHRPATWDRAAATPNCWANKSTDCFEDWLETELCFGSGATTCGIRKERNKKKLRLDGIPSLLHARPHRGEAFRLIQAHPAQRCQQLAKRKLAVPRSRAEQQGPDKSPYHFAVPSARLATEGDPLVENKSSRRAKPQFWDSF